MHYWIPKPDEISRNVSRYLAVIFQKIFAVHYSFAICTEYHVPALENSTRAINIVCSLTILVRYEIIIYEIDHCL